MTFAAKWLTATLALGWYLMAEPVKWGLLRGEPPGGKEGYRLEDTQDLSKWEHLARTLRSNARARMDIKISKGTKEIGANAAGSPRTFFLIPNWRAIR
jgi:hypothetical protein